MIESTDDNVEIQIFQNGKLMRVVDTQNGGSFDLHSGSYTLRATTTEAGQGTEENAFQVTPATLVMLRGGRQIVKVTQPRSSVAKTTVEQSSGQGRAERKLTASKNQLHTGFHKVTEPAKPIDAQPSHKHGIATTFGPLNSQPQFPLKYGGKSFDQWFEIAKYDRSEKSCVEALVACGEIAIKQQRDKLMELTREIVQHRSETKFDTHNRQILTDGQPRFTQVLRNVVLTFPRRRPLLSLLEKLPTVQKRADSFVVFGSRHSRGKKGSTT